MKVFISWSGERSREVANLLHEWISCVLQAAKPWVSTRDIDRGTLWFHEISGQLQETTVGIICLTQQNKHQPWILFEAGALAKGLTTQRVCTLLIDLTPADVKDPLAQFNHTLPSKESMRGLVSTLNGALGLSSLDVKVMEQVFETYWPRFEAAFALVLQNTPEAQADAPLDQNEVLNELLGTVRTMSNRLARVEQRESEPLELSIGSLNHPISRKSANDGFAKYVAIARAKTLVKQGVASDQIIELLSDVVSRPTAMKILSEVMAGAKDG